jgi:hypothetical protein
MEPEAATLVAPVEDTSCADGGSTEPSSERRPGVTLDRAWTLLVWILPAMAVLLAKMPVNDLAYQVRTGALMVSRGAVVRQDPFTFWMRGRPWVDQQWGAQLVLYLLHAPAGWAGLVLVRAALVSGAFGVTYRWTRRAAGDALVAACLTLGALIVAILVPGTLALRPQLLAVPLFLGSTWVLRTRADRPRRLAWLPLVALVWANLHGSFVLLPLIVGIAFVGDLTTRSGTRRWTASVLAASLLVPLINPWGPGIYGYLWRLSTNPVVRTVIDEWRPLWRLSPAGPAFLVAVLATMFLLVRRQRRAPTLEELLGLAAFTVLALTSGRNLLWWSLYVPPVVGGLIMAQPRRAEERSPVAAGVVALLGILMAGSLVHVATTRPSEALLSEAPPGITSALRGLAGRDSRVFDGWWGSWFEYALPDVPMFVDARAEVFPRPVWDEYFSVSSASPGWDASLHRWGIKVVVASTGHQDPLIVQMARAPDWREVYRDADGVIFVRRG